MASRGNKQEEFGKEFDMRFIHNRLASYSDWPFGEDCSCTPEKMAKAGFFHCPTENEPDLVKCYVCLKELDGWEPSDDPWLEHKRHSGKCPFLDYCNPDCSKKMTIENFLKLEKERQIILVRKEYSNVLEQVSVYSKQARKQMEVIVNKN
ncbi:hypothetical protein LSH36_128g04003 [Paralvinella palmiformis]|uniref:Survivin n=1 Tax=Paralvinella palmiformis TaxID=53620 RepID=A0AAD9JXT5_9ANNE|nr:hypothetical protein LSH36_128g04003 [Paralvinella palmiformis]